MNSLEEWCFWNIICSFISLLTYGFILVSMELERMKSNGNNVNPEPEVERKKKRNVMLEAICFLITLGVFVIFLIVYVNYSVLNH